MYFIQNVLDEFDIQDLLEVFAETEYELATVHGPHGQPILDTKYRNTRIFNSAVLLFPDISLKFLSLIEKYDRNPEMYIPWEMNFLEYTKGSLFTCHRDKNSTNGRVFSTVTLLYKSDDLVGGDLIIDNQTVNLEVGQTVIFPSETLHEVTEVKRGKRNVLVCWIHSR